jgi:glycosyltransferase involved in cell wall biosynthesis
MIDNILERLDVGGRTRAGRSVRSLQIGIAWATQGAGGSGRVFADLVRHLPENGIEVSGVVSAPSDVSVRTNRQIDVFAPEGASMLARLRGARQHLKSLLSNKTPDLIASHFALYTAPILDDLKRRNLVVHFHGPWAAESMQEDSNPILSAVKKRIELAVYSRATRVIVLSRAFADILQCEYGIPESRIRIVPGAADISRFAIDCNRMQARERLSWPLDKRILVTVRRLVSRMGLDRLIDAMAIVVANDPNTILYIAGKGRLRAALEERVSALKLTEHVRFLGFVSDDELPLIYKAADLNVVPTLALEGFGLVAVEALAAGTPSMVTPVGGLPEVISGLSPDLVFASASVEDIAQGISGVVSGSIALPSSLACRSFAAEHYSVSRMVAEVADVYREACAA